MSRCVFGHVQMSHCAHRFLPLLLLLAVYVRCNKIDPHGKRARRDGRSSSSNRSPPSPTRSSRRTELLLTVHFDNYTSKMDEYYGEQEWRDNKLAPLYSQVREVNISAHSTRVGSPINIQ